MDNLCREHATTLSAAIIPTAEGLCNLFHAREIVAALGPVRGHQKRSAALGEPITPRRRVWKPALHSAAEGLCNMSHVWDPHRATEGPSR